MLYPLLFHTEARPAFSEAERTSFERILREAGDEGTIRYEAPYPKSRFIDYVVESRRLFVHGSNRGDIETFEPRRQTLFDGRAVDAVFASRDGVWSLFYATLDRGKVVGNFRNGCFRSANGAKRYYFFSLTRATRDSRPWTQGTVYFLPADSFAHSAEDGKAAFDEWVSKTPVRPKWRLPVEPADFAPYRSAVATHRPGESIVVTWLLYKIRTKLRKPGHHGS